MEFSRVLFRSTISRADSVRRYVDATPERLAPGRPLPGREVAAGDDGGEQAGAVGAADVDRVDGGGRRHVERRGADDVQPDPVTGLEPVADRPQLHVVAPGLTDSTLFEIGRAHV